MSTLFRPCVPADDKSRERERIHLLLLDDARHGLADIATGRTVEGDTALAQRQQQRAAASGQTAQGKT
jgi:hypothetical protein